MKHNYTPSIDSATMLNHPGLEAIDFTITHEGNVTCAVNPYDVRSVGVCVDGRFVGSIHFIRSYGVYQAQGNGVVDRLNTTAQEAFDKLMVGRN
ncbi:MAG: hypothetical protein IAE79_07590 [Anaerolinea sp.]|nr:hypothetical protein [Anaerolinea sp.]